MAIQLLESLIDQFSDKHALNKENKKIKIKIISKQELISNKELCFIIMEYLDHLSIINFIQSNNNFKFLLDTILTKLILFRSYLNEWKIRNNLYGIDNNYTDLELLRQYGGYDGSGYGMYTLISIKNDIAIDYDDKYYDGNYFDKAMDILPTLALEDWIDIDSFNDINCVYCTKDKRYKYNLYQNIYGISSDINPSSEWKEITQE
eukprot:297957_1